MRKWPYTVSAVFPSYNEESNIEGCILVAEAILRHMVAQFEIIVVDDGSTDGTAALAEALVERCPSLRVIRHKVNLGYGAAIRTGFASAHHDLLFFSDSDRQFDILNLDELLQFTSKYPIVVGYRARRIDPPTRIFVSWLYNIIVRHLFDLKVRDIDCAFKIFRREVFHSITIESNRWFVNTEIMAKARALGLPIAQVPVRHLPRAADYSKVKLSDIPRTVNELRRIHLQVDRMPRSSAHGG